jgi:C-terminal processing protease CtpA/Prc
VDIRDNGGGSTGAAEMFIRYLNTKKDTFKSIGNTSVPIQRSEKDLLYDGNIYVLNTYGTFSAGTDFAAIFQANGFGKIVGQPKGNNASYCGKTVPHRRNVVDCSLADYEISSTCSS